MISMKLKLWRTAGAAADPVGLAGCTAHGHGRYGYGEGGSYGERGERGERRERGGARRGRRITARPLLASDSHSVLVCAPLRLEGRA